MSILLVTYLLNSWLLFILGLFFLRKYYNLGGMFFFSFCSATSLWFIFFILSYFSTQNLEFILLFWKTAYYLSIISLYSFLWFLLYFDRKRQSIQSVTLVAFWAISFLLGYFYIYTWSIIDGLYFDSGLQDWYENPWKLYLVHVILSLLFIPLSIVLWIYRFKNVSSIDKKRLQYIFVWMLIFILCCFLFLLILPMTWVRWQTDRYISFFFLPFIIWVFYSIRRYDFLDFKITFMNVILFTYSFLVSFFLVKIIRKYTTLLHEDFRTYWGVSESWLFVELAIGIWSFMLIFYISRKKLSTFFTQTVFNEKIEYMKTKIPFILNIKDLNKFLKNEFSDNFHIEGAELKMSDVGINKKIMKFFKKRNAWNFIMNDIVFKEENKNLLWKLRKDLDEIDINIYLLFPLKSTSWEVIGIFEIWSKPLKDPFLTSEFRSLQSFASFLSSHLKYIEIYSQIQELTLSLDKKVDEKTIEYNILLNKQKEFIAYVWHEIKNPITNALFLTDTLKEATQEQNNNDIKEDTSILYDELVKVSKLVKHIFSAEKFDLDKVELYTAEINLSQFFLDEIQGFKYKFPNIEFIDDIELWILKDIDETQFRQVIQNLINNAIKFINSSSPKISISLHKSWDKIKISIHDNWKGFHGIDVSEVFGKYATWWWNAIGLGMGLYLCKKIVELHGGKIAAWNSKIFAWACFCIEI